MLAKLKPVAAPPFASFETHAADVPLESGAEHATATKLLLVTATRYGRALVMAALADEFSIDEALAILTAFNQVISPALQAEFTCPAQSQSRDPFNIAISTGRDCITAWQAVDADDAVIKAFAARYAEPALRQMANSAADARAHAGAAKGRLAEIEFSHAETRRTAASTRVHLPPATDLPDAILQKISLRPELQVYTL